MCKKFPHQLKLPANGAVLFCRCSHGLQAVGRQRVPQDLIGWKVVRLLQ